jgi:hypothetical protein
MAGKSRLTFVSNTSVGLARVLNSLGSERGIAVSPFPDFINYHWDTTYGFAEKGD